MVVGFDAHFSYYKLARAHHYLRDPACLFLATNTDHTFPDLHCLLPATGCFVSALATCTGRTPTVIGKPERLAFEAAQQLHPELRPESTLMVGDKLSTDVMFGKVCGMLTMLVKSGFHSQEDLRNLPLQDHPDFVAPSIDIFNQMD